MSRRIIYGIFNLVVRQIFVCPLSVVYFFVKMFSQHNRHKFLKAPQSRIQVEEARRHGAEIDCVVSDLGLQRCQLMCFIDKIGEKFGEVRGDIDTSKY